MIAAYGLKEQFWLDHCAAAQPCTPCRPSGVDCAGAQWSPGHDLIAQLRNGHLAHGLNAQLRNGHVAHSFIAQLRNGRWRTV